MTHSHALGLDIVAAAPSARRLAYVGLISGATKRFVALHKLGIAVARAAARRGTANV